MLSRFKVNSLNLFIWSTRNKQVVEEVACECEYK